MVLKMEERVETTDLISEQPSKYEGLGAAMVADWFLVWHWSDFSHQGGEQFGLKSL